MRGPITVQVHRGGADRECRRAYLAQRSATRAPGRRALGRDRTQPGPALCPWHTMARRDHREWATYRYRRARPWTPAITTPNLDRPPPGPPAPPGTAAPPHPAPPAHPAPSRRDQPIYRSQAPGTRETRKPVRSVAGLPELLSATYRNRVRKLSPRAFSIHNPVHAFEQLRSIYNL
jgi:hypothetical protein